MRSRHIVLILFSWLMMLTPTVNGQLFQQSAEDVARSFLDAWNNTDLAAMYETVSPQSRELYPFEFFERRYTTLHDVTNFQGVEYTINGSQEQGVVTAVNYDMRLQSPIFGEIEDTDRIMRLVQTETGWRVAWSTMDIFDGLASDILLRVQTRFPDRANIYDRDGDLLVEQNGTMVGISLVKQDMASENQCTSLLAAMTPWEQATFQKHFANYNATSVFGAVEVDLETYVQYRDQLDSVCGTSVNSAFGSKITQFNNRTYRGGGAAAHVTGYVGRVPADELNIWQRRGYQAGDTIGRAGIELAYEPELAGQPERVLRMVEPGGATIRELAGAVGSDPVPLQLTIDLDLQEVVYSAIIDAYRYASNNWATVARGSAAVVMDVDTGAILAMASYPTFDPRIFHPETQYGDPALFLADLNAAPLAPLANKAVQEQYTPGSIYKMITLSAVTDAGIWPPGDIFNCELQWYGSEYNDALDYREDWRVADELPAAGPITSSQALTASCNPFFWEMGGLMFRRDPNLLASYSEQFGLGQRTGINGLGLEATGNVAYPPSSADAINNAIGQGNVQVTTLQMARVVSAIANRGTVWQPYIVQQVGGFDGTEVVEEFTPTVANRLDFDDEVFDVVWEGMCDVPVDPDLGTAVYVFGEFAELPAPYTSCGKTGTAEAGSRGSGIPPHAWYAAFAPRENPEIAVVVFTANSREGSQVSAPMTRRILDYYFGAEIAPFPEWWEEDYIPLEPPVGVAGLN